jgi:hypothetical protein
MEMQKKAANRGRTKQELDVTVNAPQVVMVAVKGS